MWINLSGSLADKNYANEPCSFATRNARGLLNLPSIIIVLKGERNGYGSGEYRKRAAECTGLANWLLG